MNILLLSVGRGSFRLPVISKLTYKEEYSEKLLSKLTEPKVMLTFLIIGVLIGSLGWYVYSHRYTPV